MLINIELIKKYKVYKKIKNILYKKIRINKKYTHINIKYHSSFPISL